MVVTHDRVREGGCGGPNPAVSNAELGAVYKGKPSSHHHRLRCKNADNCSFVCAAGTPASHQTFSTKCYPHNGTAARSATCARLSHNFHCSFLARPCCNVN